METLSNWKNVTLGSLSSMGKNIGAALPKIVGAIAILILGWLIIKIVLFILGKILKLAKMDALSERINEMDLLGNGKFNIDIVKITLGFVKWLLLLVFFIVAADILDWGIISTEIGNLLRYLPRLFTALVLFTIGLYLGSIVKNAIKNLFESFEFGGGKIISGLMFYVIVIFMSITALNQAGVDTTIITNNITLIMGSFLLAFALGLGLGSREIVADLLRSFYTRKNYAVGDKVVIGEDSGIIEAIENNSLTLVTKKGKFVIPIKDVVSQKVEIKS
ncbi:mechanosensitive ion channel [Flagellimonas olearia]|uniref:Mechanosensitive ion channel n=1 Tax=Flagellimonas olearia TaxID=552546 RepID=A0A6I1E1D8_9FLAO|nr:mechanosensitive ion channel [Allomuricauda olearia]KAB7529483.1 mechanosensitive ion channel [Allomuricauda olearia]